MSDQYGNPPQQPQQPPYGNQPGQPSYGNQPPYGGNQPGQPPYGQRAVEKQVRALAQADGAGIEVERRRIGFGHVAVFACIRVAKSWTSWSFKFEDRLVVEVARGSVQEVEGTGELLK